MGDNSEGSSRAAQGAQDQEPSQDTSSVSFIDWVLQRRGRRTAPPQPKKATELDRESAAGQRQMLVNLRNMRDMRVEDVAIPRADIVAVPNDIPASELKSIFRESGMSRIPVYDETLDHPLGFIHIKDFAMLHGFRGDDGPFDMTPMIRELLIAPPSMPIGALLLRMRDERMHMALVVDEYGGVDGLLTMEDLVEQIVGEILDEHDTDDDESWTEESKDVYRALARTSLDDFETAAGVDLLPDDLDEDVDTLGGLVFMLAGRVPVRGEVVRHPQGHEFEVLDADARRVQRLRVRVNKHKRLDAAAE